MTENIKKLDELARADEALAKRLTEARDREAVAAVAAEAGITLTEADFEAIEAETKRAILARGGEKLSDDELDAVAGGDYCLCVAGGGGVYKDGPSNFYGNAKAWDMTCACVVYGQGNYRVNQNSWRGEELVYTGERCSCIIGGEGETTVAD